MLTDLLTCLQIRQISYDISVEMISFVSTVEPRYDEVPRDWENVFVIKGVRYIGVLFHTFYCDFNWPG